MSAFAKLEINCDGIFEKITKIRQIIPEETKILCIAKANAYGMGSEKLCKILDNFVDYFGVATVGEGIELRKSGVRSNILVLSEPLKRDINKCFEYDLDLTVYRLEFIDALDAFLTNLKRRKIEDENTLKFDVTIRTHFKVETGLQRTGSDDETVLKYWFDETCENMEKTGVFSHFQNAGFYGENQKLNENQIKKFNKITNRYKQMHPKLIRHLANSYATEFYPTTHYDMVRIGQSLYKENFRLSVKIKHVFNGTKNMTVGYGCDVDLKYRCKGDEKLATLGIGFADGLSTIFSNSRNFYVMIKGFKCRLVSPIMMDMIVVKLHKSLQTVQNLEEDEAVIISDGRDGAMSLEYLKTNFGVHVTELMTRFGRRIERIYINE